MSNAIITFKLLVSTVLINAVEFVDGVLNLRPIDALGIVGNNIINTLTPHTVANSAKLNGVSLTYATENGPNGRPLSYYVNMAGMTAEQIRIVADYFATSASTGYYPVACWVADENGNAVTDPSFKWVNFRPRSGNTDTRNEKAGLLKQQIDELVAVFATEPEAPTA